MVSMKRAQNNSTFVCLY